MIINTKSKVEGGGFNKNRIFFKWSYVFLMFLFSIPSVSLCAQDNELKKNNEVNDVSKANEVKAYMTPGNSIVYNANIGFAGLYTRHLTDRVDVTGGIYFSTKRKFFFSSLNVAGSYRLPLTKSMNLYGMAKLNFTNYSEFHLKEYVYRLAVKFESNYFDLELGNSIFNYRSYGEHLTEAYNPSFGLNLRFKKLSSSWYAGVFLRNFDDFYFENFNVIWGCNGYYKLNDKISFLGELDIQPAGNMSQLATKYAYYFKLGGIYKW